MQFLIIIGIMVAVLGIALLGMAIRLVLVKDGEVRGGCAGKNPMMQEEVWPVICAVLYLLRSARVKRLNIYNLNLYCKPK